MNLELFDKLMVKGSGPRLRRAEWRIFLETCERYLQDNDIKNPVAVEIGVFKGRQRKFYEQLFGAEYIGIDILSRYVMPEVLGNTHDPKTVIALKEKLKGRPIDILFIDACHSYECVKQDFEMYAPLCTGIVGFHDIESGRYGDNIIDGAWRFWQELRTTRYEETKASEKYVFMSIHYAHFKEKNRGTLGIGVMIKQ